MVYARLYDSAASSASPLGSASSLAIKTNIFLRTFLLMQVLLSIPFRICEHNFRAVGSKNPEKTARTEENRLRKKCNEAVQSSDLCQASYSFCNWTEDVESCHEYHKALADIQHLYEANDEFRADVNEATEAALRNVQFSRGKGARRNNESEVAEENAVDLKEGVLYKLKELAFLVAAPSIYENFDEYVFVYHRPAPLLEKYFAGGYDGIVKPYFGFVVFE